jgi:hypothetical protein
MDVQLEAILDALLRPGWEYGSSVSSVILQRGEGLQGPNFAYN